jgi:MauM/NapG family ferredoxin protein
MIKLNRRSYLFTAVASIVAAALFRHKETGATITKNIIRPPGALPEEEFVDRCIRCNACFRACPTMTLVPASIKDGLSGYGTPILAPREGGCLFECTACGDACPTGAIASLALEPKQRLKMGTASVDVDRCLPYKKEKPCVACVASCPTEAIFVTATEKKLPWGDNLVVPGVNASICTGCGLCEAACPVEGAAAIIVSAEPRQFLGKKDSFDPTPYSLKGLFYMPGDS